MGKKISVEKKWISLSQQAPLEEQWTQRNVFQGMKNTQIYGYNLLSDPEQREYSIVCPHCLRSQLDSGLMQQNQCPFCLKMFNIEENITSLSQNADNVPKGNKRCSCKRFASKLISLLSKNNYSFVNPSSIKSIVLSINKDTIIEKNDIYNKESDVINYEQIMKQNIIPFFGTKSRIVEKDLIFNIGDIELKVTGMIPKIKGKVSITTRIQCTGFYCNNTVLTRALLITKVNNEQLTINRIRNEIINSSKDQLSISKGNEVVIGRHELFVRNCIPECGVITPETVLTIEQKNVKNITKIKMAVIIHNRSSLVFTPQFTKKDYEKYIIEEYYKPYFMSGVSKYIERGDIIKIEDIELFVLNSFPETGYINSNTLLWLKFNKTKDQCLEHINRADDRLALGMINSENQSRLNTQSGRRTETSNFRLRILGEYFLTREIIHSVPNNITFDELQDIQIISQNDLIRQQKLSKIVVSLPTFEINEKYLSSIQNSEDEINKKCVICMEDYIINEKATTLPCFHIFHKKCIDSWFQTNYNCPICKCSIDKE